MISQNMFRVLRLQQKAAEFVTRRIPAACLATTAPQPKDGNGNGSLPELPPCDFQPEEYKGMPRNKLMEIRKTKLNPALLTYYRTPVIVNQGHMQYLWDIEGRRYLDMFAGIVTISVGHCHPRVLEAATEQMQKLWHTTNIYMYPTIHEYAEKLAAKLPGNLKVVYLTNSGSEANDMALHMARLYTGVYEAISLRNAYHGASPYLMGMTALNTWRYNTPTGLGIHQTMNPDVFRGPWGGARCRDSPAQTLRQCDCAPGCCKASEKYQEQLMEVLQFSMPKGRVGGFFAETIQGVGGAVHLPKGFLKGAYEMVRAHGGVCIADEVQTGFGRLGSHYWGFETHDVVPDIVTMAKGIGNGFPMAAVVTTPEIAAVMTQALHFNTFGGNPVASAVGSAVLDVIDEEKIQERAADVGTYLIHKLLPLRDEFEIVGDIRGKGLMIGIELVQDKASQKPLSAEAVGDIWEDTKNMGLLIGKGGLYGTCFRVKPPMCVTKQDADFTVAVLRQALKNHSQRAGH